MCERGEPFGEGELRNNNQQGGVADGDANANDIQTEDERRMGDTSTLTVLMAKPAAQDKVVIWGTDSQCDDPELAEFEMLECQELEAYLVEEGEDFVGLADCKELHAQPQSCNNVDQSSNANREERMSALLIGSEQESNATVESRDVSRTELSSETDVFVSCLSTISAVESVGRTQTTDSWHVAPGPFSTISEDLTLASQTCSIVSERGKVSHTANHSSPSSHKSTRQRKDVDMNLNSTVHSDDVVSQVNNVVVQCKEVTDEHKKNNNQRSKTEIISEGDRGRTEHKTMPTAKVLNDERNTKMDKSTQADETPDGKYGPYNAGTKGNQSSFESKAIKKQGSFDNTLKKQNSFDRTFNKQPSFEKTLKKQLSFDNTPKKQSSSENTVVSSSSSLERRKPWGSPSRPATPMSSKTTSCSPKRRPPGSPAKVQGIRALSLERSSSPQSTLSHTVKPSGKTLFSGIPKPVMPQQREPELKRSSPPQKPKNVRPKIITYVRKSPQTKADGSHEASTHPLRLSSYASSPAHKEPKAGRQPKPSPVLCSSNLLFDKYRQEMQKVGFCPPGAAVMGSKPPNSTIPQRLTGRSDSFHEEVSEKYVQEVRNTLTIDKLYFYKYSMFTLCNSYGREAGSEHFPFPHFKTCFKLIGNMVLSKYIL